MMSRMMFSESDWESLVPRLAMIGIIKISYESLVKFYRFPLVPLSDAFNVQRVPGIENIENLCQTTLDLRFLFLRTSAAKAFKSLNALGDVLPSRFCCSRHPSQKQSDLDLESRIKFLRSYAKS